MRQFRQLDYFPKASEDAQGEKTTKGGILSIVASVIVVILVIYESYQVFFGSYKTYPFLNNVDPNTKVRINLNITFEETFCKALSVDYQDSTGNTVEDIRSTLHKFRLDRYGRQMDAEKAERVRNNEKNNFYPDASPFFQVARDSRNGNNMQNKTLFPTDISCYGAELHEGQQCFTCSDVLIAFAQRGWPCINFEKRGDNLRFKTNLIFDIFFFDVEPIKEQISQCNGDNKEAFMITQKSDGEIQGNKELAAVIGIGGGSQQIALIDELKNQNLSEQVLRQIDSTMIEEMTPADREHMETQLLELNELQYNPEGTSERQNQYEIAVRIQELQALVHKYTIQRLEQNPKSSLLQIIVSNRDITLMEIPDQKRVLLHVKLRRQFCLPQHAYTLKMTTDLPTLNEGDDDNKEQNQQKSDFFSEEGGLNMGEQECAHAFPVFISRSQLTSEAIILSIPALNIQQQYVVNTEHWTLTFSLSNQDPPGTTQINIESPRKPNTANRLLFASNFGSEHMHTTKEFTQQDINEMMEQMAGGEKCQIYGHIYVKKVPGNFHFSFHNEGLLTLYTNRVFNLHHTIHTLEFTTEDAKLSLGKYTKASNPLDGTSHDTGHGLDNDYYLKIMGSVFENMFSNHTDVYSFTALESRGRRDFRLPAVNFKYEFDPISVLYYRKSRTLSQFLVSLCAIIGGSIALSKYLHTIIDR